MGEFTSSVSNWVHNLSINSVIMMIMMIFMIVGAVDKIRGNKKGYGEKFEEGFNAIGPLALSMAGVVAAAPVLAQVLGPIIKPIYTVFGADPSMFATTLLACDMGGYPLAMQLAGDQAIGNFAGLILGTMMGPTIVFTIPVALGIIDKKDRGYLGAGVLAGMITIPIGCVIGGIAMTAMTPYKLSIVRILQNLIPVIIIAGLIVFGLWVAPAKMINGFNKFGTGVTVVITALTAIAVLEQITGIMFPLFDQMATKDATTGLSPLDSGLLTYNIRSLKINNYLVSLLKMVHLLSQCDLYPTAVKDVVTDIVEKIRAYIEDLKANRKYDDLTTQVKQFKLATQIFDVFGESVDNYFVHDIFTTTDTDIDRQFRLADVQLGNEGIGNEYGRLYYDEADPSAFQIDVILFAADSDCITKLHEYARKKFHSLNDQYRIS